MELGTREACRRLHSQPTALHLFVPDAAEHPSLETHRTIADWASDIRNAWNSGAKNILDMARLTSRARQALRERGEWSRLWQDGVSKMPFSKRKAEMLARIGLELGGLSAQNFAHLPPAWSTLYYVAWLGQRTVERLVQEGRIHPRLSLQDAKDLLAEHQQTRERKPGKNKLQRRFACFAGFVRDASVNWSAEERRFASVELLNILKTLRSATAARPSTISVS